MQLKNPDIDQTKPAFRVVSCWSSVAEFCRQTALPYHTVYRWLRTGYIPAERQRGILESAARCNVKLAPAMFVELP